MDGGRQFLVRYVENGYRWGEEEEGEEEKL